MAKSQSKAKIAQLRKALGISVGEFARHIGKSVDTVRSLESGRLALSNSLAETINTYMGVNLYWLLNESMQGPPIDDAGKELAGEKMIANSVAVQAAIDKSSEEMAKDMYPIQLGGILKDILSDAAEGPHFPLAIYKAAKFCEQMEREFVPPYKRTSVYDDILLRLSSKRPKKSAGSKKKETDQETKAAGSKKRRP
jgi:transcriptional regulator with XRE-family HTH domain